MSQRHHVAIVIFLGTGSVTASSNGSPILLSEITVDLLSCSGAAPGGPAGPNGECGTSAGESDSMSFEFAMANEPGAIRHIWRIESLSEDDVGQTFVADSSNSAGYPELDFDDMTHLLTNGESTVPISGDILLFSLIATGGGYGVGNSEERIFYGDGAPGFVDATTFVPLTNGFDLGGYVVTSFTAQFDKISITPHDGGTWIGAQLRIGIHGNAIPEPSSFLMLSVVSVLIGRSRMLKLKHREMNRAV